MHSMRPSGSRAKFGRGLWVRLLAVVAALGVVGVVAGVAGAWDNGHGNVYKRVNLISDIDGVARITDPNLVNPWGLAAGPTTPLWVNDNGMDVSTLYKGGVHGSIPQILPLAVKIPQGAPTGIVFNSTQGFKITMPDGSMGPSTFIFDSEAGVISAWMVTNPPQDQAVPEMTVPDAVYKGLAIGTSSHGTRIYASNFHAGTVDVFDDHFQPVHDPGAFTDPNLPPLFAPFGIQELNGKLYVSYAKQKLPDKKDDDAAPGNGFVDVYNNDGHLLKRLISDGALNSPWGLVIAPRNFGPFGGDLLVGNFGDGAINAYDRRTGAFDGTLKNRDGNQIKINGLWGLRFGNGTFGTRDTLVFSAGIGDEDHGLLGEIKFRGGF